MAENNIGKVIFLRGSNQSQGSSDDDVSDDWDDTALIKAYDSAINVTKAKVTQNILSTTKRVKVVPIKTVKTKSPEKQQIWKVGSLCRAVYSEDSELYEGKIVDIDYENNKCSVEFLGYGNSECIDLSSLLESAGSESRMAQIEAAKEEHSEAEAEFTARVNNNQMKMDFETLYGNSNPFSHHNHFPTEMPPAPPLPPQLMARLPENNTDALSSMLMSWYVSGFHTGYYHGLKHARESRGNQRSGNQEINHI